MKILFVAMQYIHAARWINQLKDSGHEIYLFDCLDKPIHKELEWTNSISGWSKRKLPNIKGEYFLEKKLPYVFRKIESLIKVTASEKLIEIISEIKPDLVHSLEMQSQTYPVLKARKKVDFKWAYSCWGNDIYYYKDLESKKIRSCVNEIDYFFLECERDEKLVKEFNNNSKILGTKFPGGGGYLINDYKRFKKTIKDRKTILIKGYEHKFGRALLVLDALELIVDKIKDYQLYVYSAHDVVADKILYLNKKYNLEIEYSTRTNQISHTELLEKFGSARIAIGNNISDGVPNTLLEAIILGAFPIQSNPGGASGDYITDGENGLLIENPNDEKEIANLIIKALTSEVLIEKAFLHNKVLSKKLAYKTIQKKVLQAYQKIEAEL